MLAGGGRPERRGSFVERTVLETSTTRGASAGGDVRARRLPDPVQGEEQAIAIANDTPYGLAAGVWTENAAGASPTGHLRAGTVWVNNYRVLGRGLPFGGFKQSGLGRELGIEASHGYTEVKSVWIDTGNGVQFPYGPARTGMSSTYDLVVIGMGAAGCRRR